MTHLNIIEVFTFKIRVKMTKALTLESFFMIMLKGHIFLIESLHS